MGRERERESCLNFNNFSSRKSFLIRLAAAASLSHCFCVSSSGGGGGGISILQRREVLCLG